MLNTSKHKKESTGSFGFFSKKIFSPTYKTSPLKSIYRDKSSNKALNKSLELLKTIDIKTQKLPALKLLNFLQDNIFLKMEALQLFCKDSFIEEHKAHLEGLKITLFAINTQKIQAGKAYDDLEEKIQKDIIDRIIDQLETHTIPNSCLLLCCGTTSSHEYFEIDRNIRHWFKTSNTQKKHDAAASLLRVHRIYTTTHEIFKALIDKFSDISTFTEANKKIKMLLEKDKAVFTMLLLLLIYEPQYNFLTHMNYAQAKSWLSEDIENSSSCNPLKSLPQPTEAYAKTWEIIQAIRELNQYQLAIAKLPKNIYKPSQTIEMLRLN